MVWETNRPKCGPGHDLRRAIRFRARAGLWPTAVNESAPPCPCGEKLPLPGARAGPPRRNLRVLARSFIGR
jgi:hypothetical protein